MKNGVELPSLEPVFSLIEIADDFEHERTFPRSAVCSRRTGRWTIPVTACPDGSVGCNRHVLCNVTPSVLRTRMVLIHALDGRQSAILGVIGPPGVMHVDLNDLAL